MGTPTEEQEHDVFFNHSFDLLGVVGTDGYFKRVNPAFERVLGYSAQELYDEPIQRFLHPEDVAKTRAGIQTLASGTPKIGSINRYRCKSGAYKWFSWNTTPIGPLLYTIGREITAEVEAREENKRLSDELARKNQDLEQQIQERMAELRKSEAQVLQLQKLDAIGRLAGGIAHDFNNMLAAISMYCDMLLDEAENPGEVKSNVREIRAVTERGGALTRQLLIFGRKQIHQPQAISLNPLILQIEKMLTRLLGESIRIVTRLEDGLKDITADPSQIEQVILNLSVNARDAMPMGGVLRLETSNVHLDEAFTNTHLTVTPGQYVLLTVSDEGCGMDAATLSKVFEPFFTTKPIGKGTGLGLSTTYGIVKQSQGTIWVYSEPGKGTVFKIYLPAADRVGPESLVTADAPPPVAAAGQTILLVEDDGALRTGFSAILRKHGYEVLAASGAEEALRACRQYPGSIQLLLTDVVMPGLGGFELAKQANEIRPGLRVLYMSGYAHDALESASAPDGHLDFIQKPFDSRKLLLKLQEILFASPVKPGS